MLALEVGEGSLVHTALTGYLAMTIYTRVLCTVITVNPLSCLPSHSLGYLDKYTAAVNFIKLRHTLAESP